MPEIMMVITGVVHTTQQNCPGKGTVFERIFYPTSKQQIILVPIHTTEMQILSVGYLRFLRVYLSTMQKQYPVL